MSKNAVKVVIGTQWGDEGKGKIVDMLSAESDIVARCQGGNNAGHTVVVGSNHYAFHLLPSGLVHPNCIALIGNGVVIHLPSLFREIETNSSIPDIENGRLKISSRAHLVFDFHQIVDGIQESIRSRTALGTTKKGIGPTYACKVSRSGIRVSDLIGPDFSKFEARFRSLVSDYESQFANNYEFEVNVKEELEKYKKLANRVRPLVVESVSFLRNSILAGKRILVEGANASMLDIDFGTYPYVTSSNCVIGGVLTGLGIPPKYIGDVYGIVKAYTTRVGTGSFPTELNNQIGSFLQDKGHEYGTTTGRKRRCGWLDIPMVKYTDQINGYAALALTKLDVLTGLESIKVCVDYDGDESKPYPVSEDEMHKVIPTMITMPGWTEDITKIRQFESLPVNAQKYVETVEQRIGIPIWWIGVGEARDAIICRHSK